MAKIGYIMVSPDSVLQESNKRWMTEFGCDTILFEEPINERTRPLWRRLLSTIKNGDTLVITKLSEVLKNTRELPVFFEMCKRMSIRLISIGDKIDSSDELFEPIKSSRLIEIISNIPIEITAFREAVQHVEALKALSRTGSLSVNPNLDRLSRNIQIINLYQMGMDVDKIVEVSGLKTRASVYRILRDNGVIPNRKTGPQKVKGFTDEPEDLFQQV